MTTKDFISSKEYVRAVCASCPASLACVAGLTRGVYKCYRCGKTWAFVYLLNGSKERLTMGTLRRVACVTILEAHFEVCPLRNRKAEERLGGTHSECDECGAKRKALLEKSPTDRSR